MVTGCEAHREHLRRECGRLQESGLLKACGEVVGATVGGAPGYRNIVVGRLGGVTVYLGGRADGLIAPSPQGPAVVVEAKTRTGPRGLLGLQAHERVQLLAYMHILDVPHGMLVESERCGGGEVRCHPVEFDEEFWKTEVVPRLRSFVREVVGRVWP
jgi:hypothetical protein